MKSSCYECGEESANTDKAIYDDIQRAMKLGMRWHCPGCLRSPAGNKSLTQDLDKFKTTMKNEIKSVTDRFNDQLESFQALMNSKKHNKVTNLQDHMEKQPKKAKQFPIWPKASPQNIITHQLIVDTDNASESQKSFADKVKENLRAVPISNVKIAKNGSGIISFPDEASRDESLQKLKTDFKVSANNRAHRNLLPKVTI